MSDQAIRFGRYQLDPRGGLISGRREVRLTPKALALLRVLAARPGQLFTKDELFEAVWPDATVGDAALATCVRELRRALRDDARQPRYIETLHRRGYRFIGRPTTADDRPHTAVEPPVPESNASILVGREPELDGLLALLARAQAGTRQIVFVTGEPGIGKTSLVRRFVSRAAETYDIRVAWGQSAEHYGVSEPYLPLLEALVRACRGPAGDRLVAVLARHAPTWLGQMPSLVGAGQLRELRRRNAGVTRERMLRELTDAFETAAEQSTMVLWLEDLHWADVSTIDWLASFASRPEPARLLVVGTYRPVELSIGDHPLRGMHAELRRYAHCHEVALPPLSKAAVAQYLALRFATAPEGAAPLSHLAESVYRRTEGSPLFMIGVLEDLVDRGVLEDRAGQWVLRGDAASVELGVPSDLQRLIERQLDRLDRAERGLLEVASAVGVEFSAAVVAAAAGAPTDDVETACLEIARRQQLVHESGAEEWPDGTVTSRFGFHHALYREALYRWLPAGRRVEVHRRVGDRLESAYGGRAEEIASVLAMHFQRGGDLRKAIRYLSGAGRTAGHRGAAHEATASFTAALDLIAKLPEDPSRDALEADVRRALCVPLIALHGYGSSAVEECAIRAKALCDRLGDVRVTFIANRLVWNASLMRHPVPRSLAHARELMDLATATNDPVQLALARRALGTSLKLAGELREAADVLVQGARVADQVSDEAFAEFGEQPGMICRVFAGWVRSLMGSHDEAAQLAKDAVERVRRGGTHPHALAFALVSAALVHVFQRDVAEADRLATEVIPLAQESQLPQWLAFGREIKGWAAVQLGDPVEGTRLQEEALRGLYATGARTHTSRMLANLAESYLRIGQPDRARMHLAAAHAHLKAHGELYYAAELSRLQGELLSVEGAAGGEVEAWFRDAVEIGRAQGARLLELRASAGLARFRSEQPHSTTA